MDKKKERKMIKEKIKRNIKVLMGFLITLLVGSIIFILLILEAPLIITTIMAVGLIGTISTGISLCRSALHQIAYDETMSRTKK
ncbi:MAG: hypothetical protein ACK5MR_10250 [Cumulibacter sp.]